MNKDEITIHQLVHGYRRGHRQLASSIRLPNKSTELITRLSDLSGLLTRDSVFAPYLTAYPLPDSDFHVIAKTWLDTSAARAGCVLTHTLLIPKTYWRTADNLRQLGNLHRKPDEDFEKHNKPLIIKSPDQGWFLSPSSIPICADEFVRKYFVEGLRPIVWFGEHVVEEIFWQVTTALWPALRGQFACCTFSLQIRSLEDRPFDLLFAPLDVYSRFNKIPIENQLDPSRPPNSHDEKESEPWINEFVQFIFNPNGESHIGMELKELGPLLPEDPTAIRNLFRLDELRRRTKYSPTAAIGLMDVVASLAPESDKAIKYKEQLVLLAIESAKCAQNVVDSLRSLYLISERLDHSSFKNVGFAVVSKLSNEVNLLARNNLEIAIATGEPLFSSSKLLYDSPYRHGLEDCLTDLVLDDPRKLSALHHFPLVAAKILSTNPEVGTGYLRGMRIIHDYGTAITDLASWISSIRYTELHKDMRLVFIPEIHGDAEVSLAECLLSTVEADELAKVLDTLFKSSNGFSSRSLQQLLNEQIAIKHPSAVRRWGLNTKVWSDGAAALLAASYTKDIDGLSEVLLFTSPGDHRLAHIVASYIESISETNLPLWFREYARDNAGFLVPLVLSGPNPTTNQTLERVLTEIRDLPIAREETLRDKVADFSESSIGPLLADRAIRSAITSFVSGHIGREQYQEWHSLQWATQWFSMVDTWDLRNLLVSQCHDYSRWSRAWSWLNQVPESIVQRDGLILGTLVESLISARRREWPWLIEDSKIWNSILEMSVREDDLSNHLRLCAYALEFCFRNRHFPLSQVVAYSFWPVYCEMLRTSVPSPFSQTVLGILRLVDLDWDKAKQLRKDLVNSFLDSSWPPGDLALAVKDVETLRKVFKRVIKKSNGDRYVSAIIADLHTRNDSEAKITADHWAELQRAPHFYEPWD